MNAKIGFAICGSFCTLRKSVEQMRLLSQKEFDILPIMSFNAYSTDTRFGKASDIIDEIESICHKHIIHSITDAEPIGPKAMTDLMLIAPCTGNTLAKLNLAITDTPVTMAAKSHLRQQKPLLIAVATNDALGASAQNIGRLLNVKHVYFVPMSQDDPTKKPNSIISHFDMIPPAVDAALCEKQIQPIMTIA